MNHAIHLQDSDAGPVNGSSFAPSGSYVEIDGGKLKLGLIVGQWPNFAVIDRRGHVPEVMAHGAALRNIGNSNLSSRIERQAKPPHENTVPALNFVFCLRNDELYETGTFQEDPLTAFPALWETMDRYYAFFERARGEFVDRVALARFICDQGGCGAKIQLDAVVIELGRLLTAADLDFVVLELGIQNLEFALEDGRHVHQQC